MALLQNISLKNAQPYHRLGDTSEFWPSQLSWSRNRYFSTSSFSMIYGTPIGYTHPYAWILPVSAGGMAAINALDGYGEINFSNLAGVKRATCTIAGTSFIGVANKVSIFAIAKLTSDIVGLATVDADIAALVRLVPKVIAGTSDVIALLGGVSSAVCDIIGEATVNADITGSALISSDIIGESTFDADIIASMYITATILAEAVLSGDIDAGAFMSANLYVGAAVDPLSPAALAAAVWNAVANEFNDSGTMGEKLNDAGSASNPWTETIEGTYTAEDILKILFSIAAGKTIITPGLDETATVVFRDVNNSVDRVTADMDGSERINIELNTE